MKALAVLLVVVFTLVLSVSASAGPITEYAKFNPITEYGTKQHPRTLKANADGMFFVR